MEAAQWLDSRCLRSGTFGGTDQIAAAAVVLETDIVVVKLEVLTRLLERKDLQVDVHLGMRYTAKMSRRQPQSMEALLDLAKLTRRRPVFIMHAGPNGGGHFDCWVHRTNVPPPFVNKLVELWDTGDFCIQGELHCPLAASFTACTCA